MQRGESRELYDTDTASEAVASDTTPKHTTPTWESELLISGASVFGLMQLPTYINSLVDRLDNQLPAAWHSASLIEAIYAHAAVIGLIITFLLHIATRAFWVALVGLRSVYPHGIRWERVSDGPIVKDLQRARYGDQDALIERADNASTLVFATGIAIVMISIQGALIIAPILVLAGIMQTWVHPLSDSSVWINALVITFMVIVLLPRLIDRWFGARMNAGGTIATSIGWVVQRLNPIASGGAFTPLVLTISTNVHRKHGLRVFMFLVYALLFGVGFTELQRREPGALSWSTLLPREVQERQVAAFYESSLASSVLAPRIQNDIVTDPYLRLWVPLDPSRMHAFTKSCARFRPASSLKSGDIARSAQDRTLASCLGGVFALRLDGTPIAGLRWLFFRDEARGVDGLHAYIPIQRLASGEHELTVTKPRRDDAASGDSTPPWQIPFWR